MEDHVQKLRDQWATEMPDLNTEGMAIFGRARWVTLQARPQIEAVFARYGLDSGTFDVLATLRRAGPPYQLRPTEIYNALMISSGGLTDRLGRLERLRLISRIASAIDGRSMTVSLTDTGHEIISQAMREDMAVEEQLLESITPFERLQLGLLLSKLMAGLEKTKCLTKQT